MTQGHTKEGKPVATPRLEGFLAALQIHGYPREDWPWLTEWASWLMRAVVDGGETLPVRFRDCTPYTFAPVGGVDE